MKRLFLTIAALASLGLSACAASSAGVAHGDYGYCERSVRHKHNDHVFLGEYHDHSLCEWSKYD